jgi:hypothetical protein
LTNNALIKGGGAGGAPSSVTTGTGVLTALGVNTGSAGAFVVNGGALGTPSSGDLSNATSLPVATGISGLGTGVATALAINVGSAGAPVVNGGALGTPSSGTVTNLTGTASININGTVGATTANTGTFSSTVHKGATSGTVTIAAPAVAGTQSYTLPSAVPAANGYALTGTTAGVMSWSAITASPGGSTTQVQYNNAGALGGISGFTTDGTRVTASTTIGVGGATPSTSGSGITFPATASASSNANTLDDYEEGTWTPTLGGTATYNSQTGTYTKVGRLVTVTFNLNILVLGTGSTTTVDGLPFSGVGGLYMTGAIYFDGIPTARTSVGVMCTGLTSYYFFGPTAATTSCPLAFAIFGNGAIVRGSFSYFES